LRVAIDISIWQFQVQAARGGSNPAIRTLFYRLLRLLSLSIQPIFVFDGPNKPVFKRNKRSGRGDGVATSMAKRMIRLFGFQAHDAPGEAEAECALLQQQGIVDAVLSEDVDTIMFGCTRTLRNWSAEGSKGSKTPTHISVYDTAELRQGESGLDREGMVLVALMSGGDYLPEGIPGAGVKVACEAARAGFGKSLCRLKRSDPLGLLRWRQNLIHELQTNESRHFRTKHKALAVPEDFPSMEILRYYTHPVVSPESTLDRLRNQSWGRPLDIVGLREFVRETFDWSYRGGAIKFIRVLAPSLLVRKIMQMSDVRDTRTSNDLDMIQEEEAKLVNSISTRREHSSTDATPELRISFTPTDIVGYSFEEEPEEEIAYGRDGLALNSDDEFEAHEDGSEAVVKSGPKKPFNPNEPDLTWIPETVAKLGIPLTVEVWEEGQRAKAAKKNLKKTKAAKPKANVGGMSAGSLEKFVKLTKNLPATSEAAKADPLDKPWSRSPVRVLPSPQSQPLVPAVSLSVPLKAARFSKATSSKQPSKSKANKTQAPLLDSSVNPWTIAGLHTSPRASRTKSASASEKPVETILLSSSPPSPSTPAPRARLRRTSSSKPVNRDRSSFGESGQPKRPCSKLWDCSQDEDEENIPQEISSTGPTSPSPQAGEQHSRRKLARTESMPTHSPRGKGFSGNQSAWQEGEGTSVRYRGPLSRANSIAVTGRQYSSFHGGDSSDDDSDKDDDLDLPPLSALVGRIPGATASPAPPTTTNTTKARTSAPESSHSILIVDSSPEPASPKQTATPSQEPPSPSPRTSSFSSSQATRNLLLSPPHPNPRHKSKPTPPSASSSQSRRQQLNLHNAFGGYRGGRLRTTKLYVPRKSMPGFFREVEVEVAAAEEHLAREERDRQAGSATGRPGGRRMWRRSDVSVLDLTGDD
jgi:holliday junction resolvase YEN1